MEAGFEVSSVASTVLSRVAWKATVAWTDERVSWDFSSLPGVIGMGTNVVGLFQRIGVPFTLAVVSVGVGLMDGEGWTVLLTVSLIVPPSPVPREARNVDLFFCTNPVRMVSLVFTSLSVVVVSEEEGLVKCAV